MLKRWYATILNWEARNMAASNGIFYDAAAMKWNSREFCYILTVVICNDRIASE